MKLILGYMGYMGSCSVVNASAILIALIYPKAYESSAFNYALTHAGIALNLAYGIPFLIGVIDWYTADMWSYEGPAVTTLSK